MKRSLGSARRSGERRGASATTIVMLTAADADAVQRQAEAVGAELYLTKPFSPLDLLRLVDSVGERPL